MSLTRRVLVLIFLAGLASLAYSPLNGQAPDPAKTGLTNQDVVEMVKTGLSAEIILAKIKSGPCNFDTSAAALKELKTADVPDNVILAMVEASSISKTPVAAEPSKQTAGIPEIAHLRVYRQRRYSGSALAPSIFVDDKQVARIGNGRRCSIKLSPGSHTIRSDDKSSAITLDAKAGQEYYVRIDEETGFWKGHGKLTMILAEQGSAEYKLQKPVEEDRKIAKEMIEEDTATPEPKGGDPKKETTKQPPK
jgi:hypothetical protein